MNIRQYCASCDKVHYIYRQASPVPRTTLRWQDIRDIGLALLVWSVLLFGLLWLLSAAVAP